MSQPTQGDVHVNAPLTNISVAFIQSADAFVADKVFPNVPVSKQADRYYVYDRGYFNRDEMEMRAAGTESAGSGYSVDNTPTYFANVWAFHHDIPDQVRANVDAVIAPDRDATELVSGKCLIKKEKLWATNYFASGKWTGDQTGVDAAPGANQFLRWNDAASNPIEDIRAGKTAVLESTGFEPNTLVLGRKVFDKLIDHPDIVDRVKYGQSGVGAPAMIDVSELAKLFKVNRVLVMNAIENTALEGAANVHAFIGGKHALLVYVPASPGLMVPTGGYTFSWSGLFGMSEGVRISRFRMEALKSDRVEIEAAFDQKLVSADLGKMFVTAVA